MREKRNRNAGNYEIRDGRKTMEGNKNINMSPLYCN